MLKQYTALSVVAPNAGRIVQGQKTLEVRSWHPEALPLKDVVIVENQNFLLQDGDEEAGLAVALVDIVAVHAWRVDEVEAACASYWAEGYFAWTIANVRPFEQAIQVMAKRKLYLLELGIESLVFSLFTPCLSPTLTRVDKIAIDIGDFLLVD